MDGTELATSGRLGTGSVLATRGRCWYGSAVVAYYGILKRYTAGAWTKAKLMIYKSGSWQAKPLSLWDGSAWQTIDTTG